MAENITTKNSFFKSLEDSVKKLSKLQAFSLLLICSLGIIFLFISGKFDLRNSDGSENFWHLLFRDIGITLFPIGIMSFVYESILRRNFLHTMQKKIVELMPGRYTNLRQAGVIDSFQRLRIDKLEDDLRLVEDCEIRILDIWLEGMHNFDQVLLDAALNRKCCVRILLWDPREIKALEGRCKTLDKLNATGMQQMIMANLLWLKRILEDLTDEQKEKFQIKLYKDFITVSMIGFGSEFLVGSFLRGRVSSMGTQIKVAGEHHHYFKELKNHFEAEWSSNSAELFTIELYGQLFNTLLEVK